MKFNRLLLMALMAIGAITAKSQNSVGIGTETPNTNAVLHLVSPSNDQGFLIPSMTTAQRSAISFTTAESGMMVFDSDEQSFYYWSAGQWNPISAQTLSAGTGITIDGSLQITNTGDLDETNEIQDLSLTGDILTVTNNGSATSIDLSAYLDNTDSQDLDFTSGIITLSGDPDATAIDLSLYDSDVTDDFNGDFSNLTGVPTDLADGDDVDDADADPTNEIQDLQLISNVLTITGNASPTAIDLAPFSGDNTDEQTLSFDGTNVSISGGNTIDISGVNTDAQTLSYGTGLVTISNGNSINISGVNTDAQTISLSGTNLSISGGNSISLGILQDGYEPNTDSQDLSFDGSTLGINGGTGIDISDWDTDVTDDFDGLYSSLSGQPTSLSDFTDDIGIITSADVTSWDTNAADDFDGLYGSLTGVPTSLSDFTNDVGFITSPNDADASTTNEIQSLTFDDRAFSLAISGGNTADLSVLMDNTDEQSFSFTAPATLNISGGNSIDLGSVLGGWDQNAADDFSGNFADLGGIPSGLLDGDDDTQLTDADITALGFIKTQTDDQTASEVSISPISGITGGNNVQSALAEHQSDVNSINSTNSNQNSRLNALEDPKIRIVTVLANEFNLVPASPAQANAQSILFQDSGTEGYVYTANRDNYGTAVITATVNIPVGSKLSRITVVAGNQEGNTATLSLIEGFYEGTKLTPSSLASIDFFNGEGLKVSKTGDLGGKPIQPGYIYYLAFSGDATDNATIASAINYVTIEYEYLLNSSAK